MPRLTAAQPPASLIGGNAVVVIDVDSGGVLGLESEIDIEDFHEAAQQQSSADQQHAGESNLSNDEEWSGGARACGSGRSRRRSL
jgi:hypothetical protein